MKVLAINGSPRKEGNSYHAIKKITGVLEAQGIETEILHIGNKQIRGCIACNGCIKTGECVFADDEFNKWTRKLNDADGIIIASPVYFSGMAGTLKCFLDRAFYSTYKLGKMRGKVGAAVAVCRRTGVMTTFDQINKYFLIAEITVASSSYWSIGYGLTPGEVHEDEEGMATFEQLGENMAWLLNMKKETAASLPEAVKTERKRTNFIR